MRNNIGIYALWWEVEDLIYVGQSSSISRRYTEHLYKMKHGIHTNYKIQELYTSTGRIPELIVLEYCSIEQLNTLEIDWTKELNTIYEGLNIVEAGSAGYGVLSNNSKYSLFQILKVFSMLYKTNSSYSTIANRAKVDKHLVYDIRKGNSHTWLQEVYTDKYALMLTNRDKQYISSRNYPDLVSPTGVEYRCIERLSDIYNNDPVLSMNIPAARNGFYKLKAGLKSSYKGWKLLR